MMDLKLKFLYNIHMKKQKIFVIGGPTASGKSALAVRLAQEIQGNVVNGDAIQVYQDLQILSARPSKSEMQDIPHFLFGYIDAWTNYSLADWLKDIAKIVPDLKNPVIVGGTGMYLDALVNGVHQIPEIDPEIRKKVRHMPLSEVQNQIKEYPFKDPQRMRRALEVQLTTGKPLTYFYEQKKIKPIQADFQVVYILPEREKVYQSCASRFEIMKKQGAIQEVEHLNNMNATGGVLKAIGVPEIQAYLNHQLSETEMTKKVVTATKQYAKRQMTWFRHHGNPQHIITDISCVKMDEITK